MGFHERSSSKNTPRNFMVSDRSMMCLFSKIRGMLLLLLALCENGYFFSFFLTFQESLLEMNH